MRKRRGGKGEVKGERRGLEIGEDETGGKRTSKGDSKHNITPV